MQDELFEVRTTADLGATPSFVLQHNAISRSAHSFSATAKKITAMAMALLPPDLSSLSAAFTFTEFCKALGYTKSGESFALFKAAVKECMESVIEVEGLPNKKGKKPWIMYHWFQLAEFNPDSGVCTMTFDKKLAEFLKELKWLYAKIPLSALGKPQSRYALRIYELALSYESLRGKDGNQADSWYLERTLEELRKLFGVGPGEYAENREFRRRVIDGPVKEINGAGIGVEIKTEGIKKGRSLAGIQFNCTRLPKAAVKKRGKTAAAKPAGLAGQGDRTAGTGEDQENQRLKESRPDEFAELYANALESLPRIDGKSGERFRRLAAEQRALESLRETYGRAP